MRTSASRFGVAIAGALFALTTIFPVPSALAGTARIPLIDMQPAEDYYGFQGGLYPGGTNAMPAAHADAGLAQAANVVPRDAGGAPAAVENGGAIVLLSIGMSNTIAEYAAFQSTAQNDWRLNPAVKILNGAYPSQVAIYWDSPADSNYDRVRDTVLAPVGNSEQQVQAVWLKVADSTPLASIAAGSATPDAYTLETNIGNIIRSMKVRYPNLQQVFLSSRIYGGYATVQLNPEPYAYESGFSVKWTIESQINQTATGSGDNRAGDLSYAGASPVAPWIAWGPYLWADGTTPNSEGLSWAASEYDPNDYTHPGISARQKVADKILNFFLTSPMTPWFRDPNAVQPPATNVTLGTYGVPNNFQWTVANNVGNPGGFQILFSRAVVPTYPIVPGTGTMSYSRSWSSGSSGMLWNAWIAGSDGTGTYNVRVCAVVSGACAEYSNLFKVYLTTASDTIAPVLSGIAASAITASGATIGWTSHENASSVVQYGLTTAYGSTSTDTALLTSHSRALSGLDALTTYHYRVCSTDSASNQTCSADNAFTTASAADVTAPVISGTQVSGLGFTEATVSWTTDENATSSVDFDTVTGPPYAFSAGSAALASAHSVTLSGLTPSTTYFYRLRSADAATNETVTAEATFTTPTPDTTAPVISDAAVTDVTTAGATIGWTTDEAADTVVEYGTAPEFGSASSDAALAIAHSRALTGLAINTTYYYRLCSTDAALNQSCTSGADTFATLADTVAPAISAVAATDVTLTGATIGWTTDEAADSVLEYGETAEYGLTASAAELATAHSLVLAELASGTTYHFRVCSSDVWTNQSCSDDATFVTLVPDTTAPAISDVTAADITVSSATVSWSTDEAATSLVEYGTDAEALADSSSDATFVTSHSRALTNLTASTQYFYRVCSADASANQGCSGVETFTTATPDTTAPAISDAAVSGITYTDATITWTTDENATSFVDFDTMTGPPYAFSAGAAAPLVTAHSVTLSGLTLNTAYSFRIRSADEFGNETLSDEMSFTTLADTTAPTVSDVASSGLTFTDATIAWSTDEAGTSIVEYGTSVEYGLTASDAAAVTAHSLALTGLAHSTTYHYRACSTDAYGNQGCSADMTFTTPTPDTTAPAISGVAVSGITASGATVSWTTDEASTTLVEYGTTASYGSSSSDVAYATAHSRTLTGLTDNTLYHYRVCSTDAAGNQGCSADATFTTIPSVAITLTRVGTTSQFQWTVTGGAGNPSGFRFVASKTVNPPVYPGVAPTTGYLAIAWGNGGPTWTQTMSAFNGTGTYHIRVCAYVPANNTCTTYSNMIDITY